VENATARDPNVDYAADRRVSVISSEVQAIGRHDAVLP
jgi:hypothetical protein